MSKERSKIIKDLIMDNISVLQAMQSLDLMLEDIKNKDIKNWVNNEINGYQKKSDIPKYRKCNTLLMGTVQVGYSIYKNINIPISDLEIAKKLSEVEIKDSISTIMQMAKAENESNDHALSFNIDIALVNSFKGINGSVITACRKLGLYTYNTILATIKDKLLEIFKLLEKNYGNLDELYIEFSDKSKKEIVVKEIVAIVYNDNSIKIGDDNEIKNSIVGDKDEN